MRFAQTRIWISGSHGGSTRIDGRPVGRWSAAGPSPTGGRRTPVARGQAGVGLGGDRGSSLAQWIDQGEVGDMSHPDPNAAPDPTPIRMGEVWDWRGYRATYPQLSRTLLAPRA
jgi:hypothetical protein